MSGLNRCPGELPPELAAFVEGFGKAWAASTLRPGPNDAALSHWAKLIEAWATADDMPLFVRKHANNRGSVVAHPSGRSLVPTDNSGFYPDSVDGLVKAANSRSRRATLRRIRGLWNLSR